LNFAECKVEFRNVFWLHVFFSKKKVMLQFQNKYCKPARSVLKEESVFGVDGHKVLPGG